MDQILAEARAVKARLEAQDSAAELLLTKCSQVRHKLAALQQVSCSQCVHYLLYCCTIV